MPSKQTLLVLGAGASIPFGFPSGQTLLESICEGIAPATPTNLRTQLEQAGFSTNDVCEFANALRYSGQSSVDAFLEHRTEFTEVGKAAIAAVLIDFERPDKLFNSPQVGSNWYKYLFRRLPPRLEGLRKYDLAIVTFNYDRSLEHFLLTSLRHSYKMTDAECFSALQGLAIVHVHGQLGLLPGQGDEARAYTAELTPEALPIAARGIRIIHETSIVHPVVMQARDCVMQAQRICFLGFGYHMANLQRLVLDRARRNCVLCGTTYGLTDAETETVEGQFAQLLSERDDVQIELDRKHHDVLKYLRNNCFLD